VSPDRYDVLERFEPLFEAPEPSIERFLRRRDRKRRNQRIAAAFVGIAVFVAPIALFVGLISSDPAQTPGGPGPKVPNAPSVDYVINLNTGAITLLPDPIIQSLGTDTAPVGSLSEGEPGQYAASPDGSKLAYVGTADDGSRQIFTAWIDGRRVRQVTHEPNGASWPAWSPDGTSIAYVRYGAGNFRNISVLDVRTGETTEVTDGSRTPFGLQFTPDGTSIIYTDGPGPNNPLVWTVPVTGGKSTVLIGPGGKLLDAGNASLSPDGSLVTFLGSEGEGGPLRFLANADGTGRRVIPGWVSNPAGTWSPDGSRIVCLSLGGDRIIVVDVATEEATTVAEGRGAIWLDNHTLLIES
jgi:Tol biopolymer transport system component